MSRDSDARRAPDPTRASSPGRGPDHDPIPVVAAVILRSGRVLLCQRHDVDHLPLLWEFPGGKVDPGESPRRALTRELREELGVGATIGDLVTGVCHSYPEKRVWLRFFIATLAGDARARVHRRLRWVPIERLGEYPVPPPNRAVVDRILEGGRSRALRSALGAGASDR